MKIGLFQNPAGSRTSLFFARSSKLSLFQNFSFERATANQLYRFRGFPDDRLFGTAFWPSFRPSPKTIAGSSNTAATILKILFFCITIMLRPPFYLVMAVLASPASTVSISEAGIS
jgi:hypothetical protein